MDSDVDVVIRLLQEVARAEAADEPLDVTAVAAALSVPEQSVVGRLERLEHQGLMMQTDEGGRPPWLSDAGRQYLQMGGEVPPESLHFLAVVMDDLHARAAMLHAGTMLVDEFRYAFLHGDAVEHARRLVPPAFAPAVDARLAIDLHSAAVALMVRLSDGRAAGCVAEEVLAVGLMSLARALIETQAEEGGLSAKEAERASAELDSLFDLFQDDDVLALFDMTDPSDAALAGHDPINEHFGVVDQRVESWFKPFGGVVPTGYLADR